MKTATVSCMCDIKIMDHDGHMPPLIIRRCPLCVHAPELLKALKILTEASQLAVSAMSSDDPMVGHMLVKFYRAVKLAQVTLLQMKPKRGRK